MKKSEIKYYSIGRTSKKKMLEASEKIDRMRRKSPGWNGTKIIRKFRGAI